LRRDHDLDFGSAAKQNQVQRPALPHEEPLNIAVVLHQLPGEYSPLGSEPVDTVHIGEERLTGVWLTPFQEPHCGHIDQPRSPPSAAQGPSRLGHPKPVGPRRHKIRPAITTPTTAITPPLPIGLPPRDRRTNHSSSASSEGRASTPPNRWKA